jgi:hypothetical protein
VRRSLASAAVASLAAATLAATASAALYLSFSRTTAAPGDRVVVRTGGRGAIRLPVGRTPLRVYLVESSVADSVRSQKDPRLVPLGRLALHRVKPHFANGRLEFAAPNVPPGDYTTLIHCIPCAPHSNGRTLVRGGPWPGPFRVIEATPPVRSCENSVYGDLPAGWEAQTVFAGPLGLFDLSHNVREARYTPLRGTTRRYEAIKILLLVKSGESATLTVPSEERRQVALLYAPPLARGGTGVSVAEGHAAVTFYACPASEELPYTQFNGGFVVAGSRCAEVDVTVEGRSEPFVLGIPFGASCSSVPR